jgi:chemotaxis protein methyltransferase WspC
MVHADFELLLKNTMGLDAASIGSATVKRAVSVRMDALGLKQADDYWEQLRDSRREVQELIEAVVVPETWFFRDPGAFTALVRLVHREWRPATSSSPLRLLSVPCSTGEEPYSIAMSLVEAGFSPEQFRVSAADISARALAQAVRGVYGLNSFRGKDLGFRDRYFRPAGNQYAIADWVRSLVTFQQTNLLSPGSAGRQEEFDVIFCRNLLIYFDRPTQMQAMNTLARILAPGGLLFVGPAEAFLASRSGFTSADQSMSFAFREAGNHQLRREPVIAEPARPVMKSFKPCLSSTHGPSSTTNPTMPSPPAPDLETARRWADAGQLEEAAAWCETDLRQNGPTAGAYYLFGLVRDAMGDREGAAAFYRKTIYLDPEHVEGLVHLALMIEIQGEPEAAGRLRERASRVEKQIAEKQIAEKKIGDPALCH